MSGKLERAVKLFREGRPIFIYDFDGREEEVDVVIHAKSVTPDVINWMRRFAGGLICFVTSIDVGRALGIDLMTEYLRASKLSALVKRPRYGDEPAFSIWVNHVDVKTGIRDSDRALTIRKLADVVDLVHSGRHEDARRELHESFYSPGHVPILLGRPGRRFGHTELSLLISRLAGTSHAIVICEVLGDGTDVMRREEAERYAETLGTVVVDGITILSEARRRGVI